jgi:SAM-dependent methyltransferase
MRIDDIVDRELPPTPWMEGEKIPWDDAGFSGRMLKEHLSQDHDMASRRQVVIEQHVSWIHRTCLGGKRGRVLDLGCGPGLYTERLARLGHRCTGIDFSPASIAHARSQAALAGLDVDYLCSDIRTAAYGEGYDLAMLIFGEFNVFSREDAVRLLGAMYRCLNPRGCLLLEVHAHEFIEQQARNPPRWSASSGGLFSAKPHVLLEEHFWDVDEAAATTRYFVIEAATGTVARYAASTQAYRDEEYRQLLVAAGLSDIRTWSSLTGNDAWRQEGLFAMTARKQ